MSITIDRDMRTGLSAATRVLLQPFPPASGAYPVHQVPSVYSCEGAPTY
jgi:hypothetical protein